MDATFRDRAVLLGETLVCADLHVGKDRAANVELPLGERRNLVDRLEALLDRTGPERVVIAGDLLHTFDRVPTAATETVSAITGTVRSSGADLLVTPGNHDSMLETVWDGPTRAEYAFTVPGMDGADASEMTVVACHGHVEPETNADLYVVGHEHPTLTVEGRKWHCSLFGSGVYDGADVLVLPAFSHLVEGVSINRRFGGTAPVSSPLVRDLDRFRPIVRDEDAGETREFPPLGELRPLL